MSTYEMEMECIRRLKKTIYRSPLPMKKQRTTMRAQRSGKVKVFTEDEIFLSNVRRFAANFV